MSPDNPGAMVYCHEVLRVITCCAFSWAIISIKEAAVAARLMQHSKIDHAMCMIAALYTSLWQQPHRLCLCAFCKLNLAQKITYQFKIDYEMTKIW